MQTQNMIFIDENNSLDKESLRRFALESLGENRDVIRKSLENPLWEQLHNAVGADENNNMFSSIREVESQLKSLPGFIDTYIQTALDSSERFELFVLVKAAELKSQDQNNDYFWALQIRHDQILALVNVIEKIKELLISWSKMEISKILKDKEFIKLADLSIEDQVYLEAEKVYKERNKKTDR